MKARSKTLVAPAGVGRTYVADHVRLAKPFTLSGLGH